MMSLIFFLTMILVSFNAFSGSSNCDLQLNINDVTHTKSNRLMIEKILINKGYTNISSYNPNALYRIEYFSTEIEINDILYPATGRHFFIKDEQSHRYRWDMTGVIRVSGINGRKKSLKRLIASIPSCL